MDPIAQFALLSDAAQLAVIGGLFWLMAGVAALMERRRNKARDLAQLEKVGWVPWTSFFMLAAIIGGGILAMSLPAMLRGS